MATQATIRVRTTFNRHQLAALMRDGGEIYFDEAATRQRPANSFEHCRLGSGNDYNPREVRGAVCAAMRAYGERSVECGPQAGWDSDTQEAWYVRQVCLAYGLDMDD
jgi:hypothetical protein